LLDVLQIVFQDHLLADQPLDREQLDDLILGPDSKLATLCYHLQQDCPPGQLRAYVIGYQVNIHTAISAHMTQLHLLIQAGQPGIWINALWKSW
jgi:hypothetical protein